MDLIREGHKSKGLSEESSLLVFHICDTINDKIINGCAYAEAMATGGQISIDDATFLAEVLSDVQEFMIVRQGVTQEAFDAFRSEVLELRKEKDLDILESLGDNVDKELIN